MKKDLINRAVTGIKAKNEIPVFLREIGIYSLQKRAGYQCAVTPTMPENVWQPPVNIIEWLEDFPSVAEIDDYRDGLLNKMRYQTPLSLYFIYGGFIWKTKGNILFLQGENHEMIELSNLDTVAAYLAYKRAKIWHPDEKKDKR